MLRCLFGCAHEDDCLSHYVKCPLMLEALEQAGFDVANTISERLFFNSIPRGRALAATFLIYHRIRFSLVAYVDSLRSRPAVLQSFVASLFKGAAVILRDD